MMMLSWKAIVDCRMLGRFHVCQEHIEQYPEAVAALLGQMIVTRADYSWSSRGIEYEAYGPMFFPILDNCRSPFYGSRMFADDNNQLILIELDPRASLIFSISHQAKVVK